MANKWSTIGNCITSPMMWKYFSNNQSKTKQTLPTRKRGMNTTASLQSAVLELRSNPRGINRFSLDKQFSNFCAVNLLCNKVSILHIVQQVCTGPYPNCIAVHIINNNKYPIIISCIVVSQKTNCMGQVEVRFSSGEQTAHARSFMGCLRIGRPNLPRIPITVDFTASLQQIRLQTNLQQIRGIQIEFGGNVPTSSNAANATDTRIRIMISENP